MEGRIDKKQRFSGIPIVEVMRSELVIPFEFSILSVEGDDAVGVQIGSVAIVAIGGREWISHCPIKSFCLDIVGTGEPRCTAAGLDRFTFPSFGARLAGFRNGPEPPNLPARNRL